MILVERLRRWHDSKEIAEIVIDLRKRDPNLSQAQISNLLGQVILEILVFINKNEIQTSY